MMLELVPQSFVSFPNSKGGNDLCPLLLSWIPRSGGWYIENSRTTLGEKDPVSEMNTKLWNSGQQSNKDLVSQYKRKKNYVSNILVVSDPGNPENEGKVFLFRYGQKIFDKIQEAMKISLQTKKRSSRSTSGRVLTSVCVSARSLVSSTTTSRNLIRSLLCLMETMKS